MADFAGIEPAMGSELDFLVAKQNDLPSILQLILMVVPSIVFVVVSFVGWIIIVTTPKAAVLHPLPKTCCQGVRLVGFCALIVCTLAREGLMIYHLMDTEDTVTSMTILALVLNVFPVTAWLFALLFCLLEIRRFQTQTRVLRFFLLFQSLVSFKYAYSMVMKFQAGGLQAGGSIDWNLSALASIACVEALFSLPNLLFAVRPITKQISANEQWWSATDAQPDPMTEASTSSRKKPQKYRFGGGPLLGQHSDHQSNPAINDTTDTASLPLTREELAVMQIHGGPDGEGPLSVFIVSYEICCKKENQRSGCSDAFGLCQFPVFMLLVKWDKHTVWTIKRRYADFQALHRLIVKKRRGLKLTFPGSTRMKKCCTFCFRGRGLIDNHIRKRIKGLNNLLQDVLKLPKIKQDAVFRAFILHQRVVIPDADFNKNMSIYDFDLICVVGKGTFGKVMQVRKKDTGRIYAIKVLKKVNLKKDSQIAHTKTERTVLATITHPFICSLRYAFQNDTKLFMVLDYFNGGELFFHLRNGPFNEARARFYIAEITMALAHLHKHNIVYRDLKPENVLLDSSGHIKLTDFGLSKSLRSGQTTRTFCGTPQYLAPEIVRGDSYGYGVDWWALGCITYELLTRTPPFTARNHKQLYQNIRTGKVYWPKAMSAEARTFIESLLNRTVESRLGARGSDEILEHQFFRGINWDKLVKKQVPVPFIPETKDGAMDVSYVWEEFTSEMPMNETPNAEASSALHNFSGFTYVQMGSDQQNFSLRSKDSNRPAFANININSN